MEKILEVKNGDSPSESQVQLGLDPSDLWGTKGWQPQADGVVLDTTSPAEAGTPPAEENLDTTHLENQIDELVFELYGLSEEEKSLVLGDYKISF